MTAYVLLLRRIPLPNGRFVNALRVIAVEGASIPFFIRGI